MLCVSYWTLLEMWVFSLYFCCRSRLALSQVPLDYGRTVRSIFILLFLMTLRLLHDQEHFHLPPSTVSKRNENGGGCHRTNKCFYLSIDNMFRPRLAIVRWFLRQYTNGNGPQINYSFCYLKLGRIWHNTSSKITCWCPLWDETCCAIYESPDVAYLDRNLFWIDK
jgi:hypothetical protein